MKTKDVLIGFAFGFFGGCMGLVAGPLINRDWLPGALLGFVVSIFVMPFCSAMIWSSTLPATGGELGAAPTSPAPVGPDGLQRVNLDGTPVGSGGDAAGMSLLWLTAAIGGIVLSVVAMLGAVYAFLFGGDADDRRAMHA